MARLSRTDLTFILRQIQISEAHALGDILSELPDVFAPFGVRTVDGSFNNLIPGQSEFGAADNNFLFLLNQVWRNENDEPTFFGVSNDDYGALNGLNKPISVVDADPRIISNLIVDMTENNPVIAALVLDNVVGTVTSPGLDGVFGTADDKQVAYIPNTTPDEGLSAPFNSWFTLFGQFFDHGLDLINKGGNGTVFVPLQPDDPLYNPDLDGPNNIAGDFDDPANFMAISRASTVVDTKGTLTTADDIHYFNNQTTPFVDQNQTYTSHPSHQVFLREYAFTVDGPDLDAIPDSRPVATGNLLNGAAGGLPTWLDVKNQAKMLGINLTDADLLNLPLVRTDAYGKFIPAANGYAQLVTGVGLDGIPNTADDVVLVGTAAGVSTATALRTNHAFLDDIAHAANPAGKTADTDTALGLANDPASSTATNYDNELLDVHFITGDGRGNENIGLTTVHHIFHSEHNRQVDEIKATVLASGDPLYIADWLVPGANQGDGIQALEWNGERLFQAARFATEMQYQHLVFEEFARKVQPNIDPFLAPIGYDVTINAAIVSEFANVVYRFGHSMLTETVDRFDPDFNVIGNPNGLDPAGQQMGLIAAFLNPLAFNQNGMTADEAAGAVVRGMTRQVGNEIDEFVTEALRNNLVGLPLDLAAINMARARDTGVPSLNAARREFYQATMDSQLTPYVSWVDFAGHLKHEESVVNFIAAYGTHSSVTSATTLVGKRLAAANLVFGDGTLVGPAAIAFDLDRLAFLNSTGIYANVPLTGVTTTGVDAIDFWIGGLAEKQMPFGGLLGSSFNFVFENQLENLQNGDRFYYLSRTTGLDFAASLENNSFAQLIMRNTDATHLPADIFSTPAYTLEVNDAVQFTGEGVDGRDDPAFDPLEFHLTPLVVRDNPETVAVETHYLRYTGEDHVVLGGTNLADTIISSIGDDTIYGDGGNDRIEGGDGVDKVFAGDGDDIITDLGGDDVLRGEAGNDVIQGGNGINILFGGEGKDFIITGEDISVTFAGEGDDFVFGAKTNLETIGGPGDDWLEIGHQEGSTGDTFDQLGRDLIKGHDVFIGGGGFEDIIAEGGDDIMFGSDGQEKMSGFSGFDWADYKFDSAGVTADMVLQVARSTPATPSTSSLLDLYAFVEGLSGSRFADVLRGDNTLHEDFASAGAQGSVLDAAGIARIAGLQALLGAGINSFSSGNIILGGDGSDIIEGRRGDDVIDGDRWLNARISVRQNIDGTGDEIRTVDSMKDLIPDMLSGAINPGQLVIVREILTAGGPDYDTAMYSGPIGNYTIETAFDGTVTVRDNVGSLLGTDGTDTLRNMERLQFSDQALDLPGGPANAGPVGLLTISDATPAVNQSLTVSALGVTDANIVGGSITANSRPITYYWQVERRSTLAPDVATNIWEDIVQLNGAAGAPTTVNGTTMTVPALSVGQVIEGTRLRVRAVYEDNNGVLENVFSAPTAVVAGTVAGPAAPAALPAESQTSSPGVHFIRSDLQFMLDQIIIAERHVAGEDLLSLVGNERLAFGLRTVDGSFNNLVRGQTNFGAADQNFPLQLDQIFRNENDEVNFDTNGPGPGGLTNNSNYASTVNVIDTDPRIISNLIVDQTANNPVAVIANGGTAPVFSPGLDGIFGTTDDREVFFIPNTTPDEGLSAPFNAWMTFFGQFFDHGLDLVDKGGNGTVYMPLMADDPLIAGADGIFGNLDDLPVEQRFMLLTRATNTAVQAGADGQFGTADDVHFHNNETTPFVDQNQTYTAHASHQAFLREYVVAGGQALNTGRLLEGTGGGLATWQDIKTQAAQILGIQLTDMDIFDVPLLATDIYGKIRLGNNGFAILVTNLGEIQGVAGGLNLNALPGGAIAARTGHAFLNDIAHNAVPGTVFDTDGNPLTPGNSVVQADVALVGPEVAGNPIAVDFAGRKLAYDDELLNAHFITGDGRGNENIGLTTVHHIFHSEHNRLVDHIKDVALASNDVAFLNEWLRVDVANLAAFDTPAERDALKADAARWDGERVFQAARFGTEMQYQHLVFEEFARTVQPQIDLFFAGAQVYDTTLNPAIVAEFAHVVYRFGHSMLTETVDRFDPDFNVVGDSNPTEAGNQQIGLIAAFLNPLAFVASDSIGAFNADEAAGAIVRGLTRQQGNEIDEFVTEALRNNLVGLPLDLPAINLARGRDTGVPTLNQARQEFYNLTGDSQLAPYTSWVDFALHLKHQESVINFIAAYGTHATITSQTTTAGKRAAATDIVIGGGAVSDLDRLAFLNGPAATTGVNAIDLWIGGLAEAQMPFGGLLGSTFNFVFETQMEKLQDADRFYYLERTGGLNFLTELEGNSFAKLIMANTDATHLPGNVFTTPAFTLEVEQTRQYTGLGTELGLEGRGDPEGGTILTPLVIRNNPATPGADTNYLRYTGVDHVVLGGTADNDTIISSIGDDTLYGDEGNDRLEGGDGVDVLLGGAGDDIITDLGGDDLIQGGDGHDAIQGGNGINLVIGGFGNDFIVSGEDASEVFGGPGDDFILGSRVNEQDMGNEGGDWLEHGNADGSPGDNFDAFGLDPVIGNDIYIGNSTVDIMNAEGGDDIMVGNGGQQDHYLGASGFDWADYKDHSTGVIIITDLLFENEATALGVNPSSLDRYLSVEGLSGSHHGDYLVGSDHLSPFFATSGQTGSILTNFGLINGLSELIAPALDPLRGFDPTSFTGEILLGGAGSDFLKGGWGNEVIDGDGWLNVQIGVYDILDVDHTGPVDERWNSMTEIQSRIFSGELKVSQLAAIREIRHTFLDDTPIGGVDLLNFTADNDTAVFSGLAADYTLEFFDLGTVDTVDDYIVVTDIQTGLDGIDILYGIERLQFSDTTVINLASPAAGFNFEPVNLVTVHDGPPQPATLIQENHTLTASVMNPVNIALSVRDGNNNAPGNPLGLINSTVTYYWQVEATGGTFIDILRDNGNTLAPVTGLTFTPGDLEVGFALRVRAVYTDVGGFIEQVFSAPTAPVAGVNDAPVGTVVISDVSPTQNQGLVATNMFTDADAPIDLIGGGIPPPIVYNYQWQRSTNINAATPTWTNITASSPLLANYTPVLADTFNAGANIALRVVVTYVDGQGTAETVISAPTGRIGINTVGDGGANNQAGTPHDDWLVGNGGNDTQTGGTGNDTLTGGTGNDSQTGGAGNDVFTYTVGDGLDTVDGGADTDTLNILGTNAGGEFLNVIYDGTGAVDRFAIPPLTSTVANIEIVTANFLDGVDLLTYAGLGTAGNTTTVGVTVDLGAGTASGFSWIAGFENVTGGTGGDHLTGSTGANALSGGAGNDTLVGGAGNDTLDGGTGADSMIGGSGDDSYSVDNVNDLIVENVGEGTDVVLTTANVSAVGAFANIEGVTFVGAGNFTGTGDDNANAITGGAGNDTISGAGGNDTLNGAAGNDSLTGGAGNDTVNGGANNDTFVATVGDGNDSYLGDAGTDTYNLAATLAGAIITTTTSTSADTGSDTLNSVENIIGSQGADTITLGAAVNVIDGQGGNDTINAGGSNDTVSGGAGDDTFTYLIGDGADALDGGANNDTLNITGTAGADTLDVVYNGATFTSVEGGAVTAVEVFNADLLGGTDTLSYVGTTAAVTVDLGAVIQTASGFASIASVENVTGGTGADTLTGSGVANTLTGGAGNDTMLGGLGNDVFTYTIGNGADAVDGGGDSDTLNITGTGGADTLDVIYDGAVLTNFEGGTIAGIESVTAALAGGTDTLSYAGTTAAVTVNLTTGTASGFTTPITSVENATGGTGNDTLTGSAAANALNGGAGADTLIGAGGADAINTGAANDDVTDVIRFDAAAEFGDTVTNFDATGTVAQIDRVAFGLALNTLFDDGTADDLFTFVTGNGVNGGNTAVNLNGTIEALYLNGANGEGVSSAGGNDLDSAAAVSTEFNAEFALTAANGEATLFVINDTNANSAAVWQWIQAGGGETAAAELTLIAILNANATVTTDGFVFV